MEKRTRFSLSYYLFVFISIFLLDYFLFFRTEVKEISYKHFRDLIAADSLESVVISDTKIYGVKKVPGKVKKAGSDTAGEQTSMGNAVAVRSSESSSAKAKKSPFVVPQKKTPWRLSIGEREKEYKEMLKREFTVIPLKDDRLIEDLQVHDVDYRKKVETHFLSNFLLNWIIPFAVLFLIWGFIMRRMGGGAGPLTIGKNKAKIYQVEEHQRVSFSDVAGVDEAVEEIREVVNFLKDPKKYTRLGAKLPKGVLLVGPPGTGKTLLARAVAGESGVPFFSLSGSDFVEMFVGVGAARVRDLFTEAKQKAPCIIFIDELDAIGKSRGQKVVMGGYDERENTLNQLLTEMDGFDPSAGIIIMAATNRPEVLDAALLRPGRFDRQILVDRPDLKGREAIFRVHTRGLVLGDDVDLHTLASRTPGFAGAEIANVCNEAALLASRRGGDKIMMIDFENAIERIIAGLEKKNKIINEKERKIVAYHESGHAIIGHFTPGADPVQKVSIVPRGLGALGYTLQTPLEDRYLMSREELLGKIKGLLGGRAAEEIIFGEVSTGASNDLERVAQIARNMITIYGMSRRMPNLSLVEPNQGTFLGQEVMTPRRSEKIEQMIDEEVLEIISECYEADKKLLTEKKDQLDKMAHILLEKENIDEKDIVAILGKRPDQPE